MSELQNLSSLKYSELQKLAKDVGIKANMKSDKLIKALEEHFDHQSSSNHSVKSEAVSTDSELVNTKVDVPAEQHQEENDCKKPRPTRKAKKGKAKKKKVNKKLDLTDDGTDVNETKSVEVERCKRKLSESDTEVQFKPLEDGHENSSESRPSKRRRETFDVVDSPLIMRDNAVTDRGDNLNADKGDNNESLGEVMDAMKPEMSNTDLKDSLMAAIEKKVEQKIGAEDDKGTTATTTSHIPRFAAFLAKTKAANKRPITPGNKDWTKIHEKNFSKMESIDVYLEKKRRRNQSISNSIKKAREVANRTREAMDKLTSHKTPVVSKPASKGLPLPFKPTVTSTKSMSFNFADTSCKTPVFGARRKSVVGPSVPAKTSSQTSVARKSLGGVQNTGVPNVKLPARKSIGGGIEPTKQPERRKSHGTPFKSLNLTTDNTSHKKVFDLAASLSKPLSWKPYTGKLKPLEPKVSNINKPKPLEPKVSNLNGTKPLEPKVSNISRPKPLEPKLSSNSHYRDNSLKAPPLKNSRANRLADAKQRQADKKFNAQMKRRGIVA